MHQKHKNTNIKYATTTEIAQVWSPVTAWKRSESVLKGKGVMHCHTYIIHI